MAHIVSHSCTLIKVKPELTLWRRCQEGADTPMAVVSNCAAVRRTERTLAACQGRAALCRPPLGVEDGGDPVVTLTGRPQFADACKGLLLRRDPAARASAISRHARNPKIFPRNNLLVLRN